MSPRAIQLSRAVCLLGLLFLAGSACAQSPPAWPPQSAHYRIHMIGNAHIDAPWLWPWPEAMAVVQSTFRWVMF